MQASDTLEKARMQGKHRKKEKERMTGNTVDRLCYSSYDCNIGRPEKTKLGIAAHGENLNGHQELIKINST